MKLINNRFAVIPCKCDSCKKYIWLEAYRKEKMFERGHKQCGLRVSVPMSLIVCKTCQKEVPATKIAVASVLEIMRAEIREQPPDMFDGKKMYIEKNNIIQRISRKIEEEFGK